MSNRRRQGKQSALGAASSAAQSNLSDNSGGVFGDVLKQIQSVGQSDIQRREDGTMAYKRFVMTTVGMVIPDDVEEPEWKDVGDVLKNLDSSISWNLGDWAAYANSRWGKEYKDIAKEYGYEPDTLKVYASIARAMPTLIRNQRLSFAHHRVIAKLINSDLQLAWLAYAEFFALRLSDMKRDMVFLAVHSDAKAIEGLYRAIQDTKRLGEYEDLNPTRSLPSGNSLPDMSAEITLLQKNAEYIANEYERFDDLSAESQRSFMEHLELFASSAQKIWEIVSKRIK